MKIVISRHIPLILVFGFCLLIFSSCTSKSSEFKDQNKGSRIPVQYAQGFTISDNGDFYTVNVRNPIDTNTLIQTYILYRNAAPESNNPDAIQIHIPIHDLASLSTTHLAFLEALGVEDKLIAFSDVEYIYSDKINQMVEEKHLVDIGNEGGLNTELLIALQPDIIMAYNIGNPEYDQFDKMRSLKLLPVLNNEYLELSPLGEAEWIKFVALFFDKLELANTLFDSVSTAYNQIKSITDTLQNKPSVFTGMAFKGEWTIPGGKSFAATFLADAGANYVWNTDEKTGNFPISFEEVIEKARDAKFWLHPGAASSLPELAKSDIRFNYFETYKSGEVFNNNNRVNSYGGNDYWESAVFAPQVVLADLVKIFHPELMQDHNFVYYKKLQ